MSSGEANGTPCCSIRRWQNQRTLPIWHKRREPCAAHGVLNRHWFFPVHEPRSPAHG